MAVVSKGLKTPLNTCGRVRRILVWRVEPEHVFLARIDDDVAQDSILKLHWIEGEIVPTTTTEQKNYTFAGYC